MSDFTAKILATLDLTKIPSQISQIEKTPVTLNNVTINTNNLASQVQGALDKQKFTVNIASVNMQNVQSQMQNAGSSAGKNFANSFNNNVKNINVSGLEKAINDVSSKLIEKSFPVNTNASDAFKQQMEDLVKTWTNAKGKMTDLKISTKTVFDEKAGQNVERLNHAIVTYDNGLGQIIKKTIALGQIGTKTNGNGEIVPIKGFVEVAGQYSKSLDDVAAKTDTFIDKQKQAVAKYQNQINTLNSKATDQNVSSPIKQQGNLDKIKAKYDEVKAAIDAMNQADANSFVDSKINVEKVISEYKILVNQLREAENVATKMKGSDFASGLSIAKNNLDKLVADSKGYSQMESTLNNLKSSITSVGDTAGLNAFTDSLRVAKSELEKYKSEQKDAKLFEKTIQPKIDSGEFTTKMGEIDRLMKGISTTSDSLQTNIANLNNAFNTINSGNASMEDKVKAYEAFNSLLPAIKNQISEIAKAEQETAKANIVSNNITKWMNDNAKAAEVYGNELRNIQQQLSSGAITSSQATIQFRQIQSEAKAAGLTTNVFATSLKNVTLQVLGLGSAVAVIRRVISTIKEGVQTVTELDTALVDLRKTATASASELNQFYFEANDIAKQYGATTQQIIQSAADWSRLGFNLEDSKTMSKMSSMFSSISPGVSVDEATSGLVSVMKAYGIEAEDALDGIMSKINIVGNSFALSNKDVIEGLKRSSASMAAMGQDLDSTIALFTAAQEVLQDSATTGTALRSMSLRIRGFDEETEQLSDDLVGLSGKIIDLTKTASKPMGVSIFTDETQTKYKDFVDYFRELSEVYDEMSAKNQTALLNDLFGKRGAQAGSALIKNFATVDAALEKMKNSAGNAEQEMSIITDKYCLYVQKCA